MLLKHQLYVSQKHSEQNNEFSTNFSSVLTGTLCLRRKHSGAVHEGNQKEKTNPANTDLGDMQLKKHLLILTI